LFWLHSMCPKCAATSGLLQPRLWVVVGWACGVGSVTVEVPKLLWANFSIEANSIRVVFDRSTLEGALPVDSNGDSILDSVDYSKQLKGEFDCSKVLADATVVMLSAPPAAKCTWESPSRFRVDLAEGHRVDIGDRLIVRNNVIYSLPKGVGWSTEGARGSIRINGPSPLEPPVVVVTGSTTIDEHVGTQLDGGDSLKIGGSATYLWALANNTEEVPNPSDLCSSESRVFDKTKVKLMADRLSLLTDMNSPVLDLTAELMEPASMMRVILTVTGRWRLSSSKMLELRRLGKCRIPTSTTSPITSTVLTSGDDDVVALVPIDHSPGIFKVSIALTTLLLTLMEFQSME